MSFRFDIRDVPVATTSFVQDLLVNGRGGCIHGSSGSGKSHAVRAAFRNVNDKFFVDVTDSPLLGLRFMADVARQLGQDRGRPILEAFRHEGVQGAITAAEAVINGHPLVVDEAQILLPAPASLEDPAAALWQEEKSALLRWLHMRVERTPTFLVGQRRIHDITESRRHEGPGKDGVWPIILREASGGFRNWQKLGFLARGNPAALTLARALVPWLSAQQFNDLLTQANDDEIDPRELLVRLGQAFRMAAPRAWQFVLDLLAALGAMPRDAFAAALAATEEPQIAAALDLLTSLNLVEERTEGLSVLPALLDTPAVSDLSIHDRVKLLPVVAHRLLATINDPRSLDPAQASRVLRAHTIFVELGDMANARHTAAIHVYGLVDIARRASIDKNYRLAWQHYDDLWLMLRSGDFGTDDNTGRHLVSYVQHYRAWNGRQSGSLDETSCLDEYTIALSLWRENALWHQRVLEGLIRLGRFTDVPRALEDAYTHVPEHPRRDELLRVRPARTALYAGAPPLSLDLLEPVLDVPAEVNPGLTTERDKLLDRWAAGILLSDLTYRLATPGHTTHGCLAFLHPTDIRVQKSPIGWVARLHELAAEGRASEPRAALDNLGSEVARELHRLVSTPSSQLDDRDRRRKGSLLSLVDTLNSDIGLKHADQRWLVGRIEDRRFIPTMRDLPATEIPLALLPEMTEGLYFARVPIFRDGAPSGPVEELKHAGRGQTIDDLLALLGQLAENQT